MQTCECFYKQCGKGVAKRKDEPSYLRGKADNSNLLSRVSAVTPTVLEDYKDMVRDTNDDLKEHLQRLEETIQQLVADKTSADAQEDPEWQAMLEEKESTQQGLKFCDQLSSQIERVVSAHQQQRARTPRHPQAPRRPQAHQYIADGLRLTNDSIQELVRKLQEHEAEISSQMGAISSTGRSPENIALQLTQLQETKDSIDQCINVVSNANETGEIERRNVFEDITMADEAYDFSVSTFGDLVTARRIHLTGRSRHVGGQLTSQDYQATIDAVKTIDLHHQRKTQGGVEDNHREPPVNDAGVNRDQKSTASLANDERHEVGGFSSRYGRGYQLPVHHQPV